MHLLIHPPLHLVTYLFLTAAAILFLLSALAYWTRVNLIYLGWALIAVALMTGCSTTGQVAVDTRAGVTKSLPYLRPGAAIACSGALALATTGQDRADIAGDIYAISAVINSLAGGAAPTPGELQSAIALATPKSQEYALIASTITGLYAGVFPQIKGDPALALQVLQQLSAGAADAANAFRHTPAITPGATPTP